MSLVEGIPWLIHVLLLRAELVGANPTPHIYAGTMEVMRQASLKGMQEVIYMANVKIYVYIYTRVYDELTK